MKKYSLIVTKLELMAKGILMQKDILSPFGIDETTSQELRDYKTKLEVLKNEQKEYKALLESKTEELRNSMSGVDKVYSDIKKMVKIKIKKSLWDMFGINDKR